MRRQAESAVTATPQACAELRRFSSALSAPATVAVVRDLAATAPPQHNSPFLSDAEQQNNKTKHTKLDVLRPVPSLPSCRLIPRPTHGLLLAQWRRAGTRCGP